LAQKKERKRRELFIYYWQWWWSTFREDLIGPVIFINYSIVIRAVVTVPLMCGTMNNGQWTMDNGQWTMDNCLHHYHYSIVIRAVVTVPLMCGTMNNGQWTMDNCLHHCQHGTRSMQVKERGDVKVTEVWYTAQTFFFSPTHSGTWIHYIKRWMRCFTFAQVVWWLRPRYYT
jgi:hypothetical protein